jgi:hypothetical protein
VVVEVFSEVSVLYGMEIIFVALVGVSGVETRAKM